ELNMAQVKNLKNSIVFENDYAEIVISKKNSFVEEIKDKKTGKSIKGDDTLFFELFTKEEKEIETTGVSLDGDVIKVSTAVGSFEVKALAFDSYFTFEIVSAFPEGTFYGKIAHIKYDYDWDNRENTGACGVAMSIWANPVYFPDAKSRETLAMVYPHLGDVRAKYGFIIAPITEHRDLLKVLCSTIDRNVGLASSAGGAWSQDVRANYYNYAIEHETSKEYLEQTIPYYKKMGVNQLDLHQGNHTFRQGDFKFAKYKDAADFKENVTDVLKRNGMSAGLHTYAFYITWYCKEIMSKPEYQKQIQVLTYATVAEDIGPEDTFLKIEEDTSIFPTQRGYHLKNSIFLLIGEELMEFNIKKDGLELTRRGCSGSVASAHKKGDEIRHLEGQFGGFVPVFGSDLFYETARLTAKAYNEGGFDMIYVDALDGIYYHAKNREHDPWFYTAAYLLEILKYCKKDPILEAAVYVPSMWGARGRAGALDCGYKGYKKWNVTHTERNLGFVNCYNTASLGWYCYYPQSPEYPGNENTKYQFFDDIDFLGTTAIIHDFSTVFHNGKVKETYDEFPALRRNILRAKKYDDLRQSEYFSKEYREKLKYGKWEYQLKEKRGGKFCFVEKDYQKFKLYDINDETRNVCDVKNPFGAQVPFVRIEAMMSTLKQNPMVMLPLDENKTLAEQKTACEYGTPINFSNNLAKVVKIFGNGKGGRIRIRVEHAKTCFGDFYIDLDFKGWREFMLLETDNGEYKAEPFEEGVHFYHTYRHSLSHEKLVATRVDTRGDMEGVRMSSIIAYEHTYEILKNPTVKIGDTALMFECELKSSDYIEFDGKEAKVYDRYGNSRTIWFNSENFKAPRGKFKATLTARALNRGTARARLTFGFTGKEVK
ncbi:MAG: hypothetical protein IIV81_03810, partial [Clostridia bacterium]|nr:hypothetical protein [Clostridia bacterium]